MIRLISFGDHLGKGTYKVHSRFNQVVNFVSDHHLVAVVHQSAGGGPFNLVLDGTDLTALNHLTIDDNSFSLNDEIVPFDESEKYDSEIELNGVDERIFSEKLQFLKENLVQRASEKSLVFLLDNTRRKHFKTSYEMELVSRFDFAMNHFNSSDTISAIRMIKGAGFGLTPSGDDFIAGFLQALNLRQKLFRIDYRDLIQNVFDESRSNNILTNAFLEASAKGWLSENFKELIRAVFYDSKNRIEERVNQVLAHGATSGADWCVGLIIGIEGK